jgi:glycine cleavage system H protein
MADSPVRYHRCSFSTSLDGRRLYTASHYWLMRQKESLWQVGFTEFATRALGEPVEFEFKVQPGARVEAGQAVGWIEGFKAVTELFCVMSGRFRGTNPDLDERIGLIASDPYRRGWLYLMEGAPDDGCLDARAYAGHLDATINSMREGADGRG